MQVGLLASLELAGYSKPDTPKTRMYGCLDMHRALWLQQHKLTPLTLEQEQCSTLVHVGLDDTRQR